MKSINKKAIVKKGTSYLMLGAVLGSTALSLMNSTTVLAAEVSPEVSQIMNERAAVEAGVVYVDGTGEHIIETGKNSDIQFSASSSALKMTIDGKKYELKGVQKLTLTGVKVSRSADFALDSIVQLVLDEVTFSKGLELKGMDNVETIIINNSTFGSHCGSLDVTSAPKLTNLAINNSVFDGDVVFSKNKTLAIGFVTNSVFKADVKQSDNQKGYYTDFINNRFEGTHCSRTISSGGGSRDDIFNINPTGEAIGAFAYDEAKDGYIGFLNNGNQEKMEVPAGVKVSSIKDSKNSIIVKLSNGQSQTITGSDEITFRNIDVTSEISFGSSHLLTKKISVINSRLKGLKISCNKALIALQVVGTEVTDKCGALKLHSASKLESVEIQNSAFKGSSGYVSVHGSKGMKKFVMNNVYSQGHVVATDLGATVLQITNSQFDDYIKTNQVIEGEGSQVIIGDAPVIAGAVDQTVDKGGVFDPLAGITATDTEDGDLTGGISVEGTVNMNDEGVYPLSYSVTDSDGNTTTVSVNITVE